MSDYAIPEGGVPPQSQLLSRRAIFTSAYAVIPKRVMTDIVVTRFPGWTGQRAWVVARPLTGFAETFAEQIMELAPGGGSDRPEPDPEAEAVLFVTGGRLWLELEGAVHDLEPGAYVFIGPGATWRLWNRTEAAASFVWIRKRYRLTADAVLPKSFVTREQDVPIAPMPRSNGTWGTQAFVAPDDLSHDMHVNIVTFEPGGVIAFAETHVMEHGLYVLEGKGVYRLNTDWVEVEAGDFMWLRAFCPQACYAGGPGRFRYLLYKDVNRHPALGLGGN
ncbi:MAG: bifunctional allantoicase/(S)-ureidoglycine aminohydrolase [Paracoccaceae bacterium]|nr:bifunctional allantoicase/(S)-ureidoglycine aminohydrolase [Paracoccaceae bacterium]